MLKKTLKIFTLLAIVGTILAIVIWYAARYISTQSAEQKALALLVSIPSKQATEDERIIEITAKVFDTFAHKDPINIPIYKLRPYITNKRLPEFIGFPDGVMETVLQKGYCDNASRMLAFILEKEGFSSDQWNMVTDRGGHSARLVTLSDGRKVFVDPFYGFVAIEENGKLTDLETVKGKVQAGEELQNSLIPLGDESDITFFKNIKNMYMAAEGENLIINVKLPYIHDGQPISLGTINGQSRDVKSAALRHKLTPYWNYMGHKYNREWTRVLEVSQPVKIVMTLAQPAEEGVLVATPRPTIDGKTLTWELGEGEKLTLQDGLAKISLKRLNSYIDVDQITIHPLN